MNRSMPGLPVHHQLPEFTQTHVHWVSDAIQPSHLLSSPSPPAPNLSQHQGLFKWVSSSHHRGQSIGASVQFSHSVVSDFSRPHESQHTRPPCPSPTPRVHPNSCALSQWCHPAISSSVVPFPSCPQSLPASESFTMSQLFAWGGQSTGVSASASVLPMNTQDWSPLGWTGWISFQSKGLSRVFSSTTIWKHRHSAFFMVQLSHPYMTTRKTIALTRWTFVGKVMSLLFNMLFRFVIAFLPRSQFFTSGGQSIGVSTSASVLPMNIQDWFPLGWNGWISLQSKGLSSVFSNTTVQKHQFCLGIH